MSAKRRMGRRLLIELRVNGVTRAVNRRAGDVEEAVIKLASSGMRGAELEAALADLANGLLDQVVKDLTRQATAGINEMATASVWEAVKDAGEYFMWEFEPSAKHCATCEDRNGKVGTAEEMEAVGLPGAGTTDCSVGCCCRLTIITKDEYEAGEKIS